MKPINWNDLKYFLALAREGSVSGAGRLLSVKHTTVARRVQALEQCLGTRLFDRTGTGYSMTQAAEKLFDSVVLMEDKVRHINHQASNLDDALAGSLKLTVAFELANRLIIPQISEFINRYPAIDLQLLMTKGLVNLAAMEADLAIRMTPSPPENLVGREVMKLHHGIYANKSVLTNTSTPTRIILFQNEVLPPLWVIEHFKNAEASLRVDDVGSMAIAAANGLGLAKLPCFIGDTMPSLYRLNLDLGISKWGIWMLNHVDLRATARVRACKAYLLELLESKRALIQGENSQYIK